MTDSNQGFKPPPVGSFPFFDEAVRLGRTWTQLWLDQGNIWNQQWTKLKEGTYEAKDWYAALVTSTELTSSALGDLFNQLTGDPTPPWKSLDWGSKDEPILRLRVSLGVNDDVSVSDLSLLGRSTAPAALPRVGVTRVAGDTRAIKLWRDNPQDEGIPLGQYIGFVMRSSSPEPIAIVTVTNTVASATANARRISKPPAKSG